MTEAYSLARKKQWANKTSEEKFAIMSKVAKAKQAKMSDEEKSKHAMMMVEAKQLKQNG